MKNIDVMKLRFFLGTLFSNKGKGDFAFAIETTDSAGMGRLLQIFENYRFLAPPDIKKELGKFFFEIRFTTYPDRHPYIENWHYKDFLWDILDQITRLGWLPYPFNEKDGMIFFRRIKNDLPTSDGIEQYDIDIADIESADEK